MLFNSYPFVFLYLPLTFLAFFFLCHRNRKLGIGWLALASCFFYGWWNPKYLFLLLSSIIFNFLAGCLISRSPGSPRTKAYLAVAIGSNLLLLGFFKYANFFIETANHFGVRLNLMEIVLPLGISFFTFTQIAFLVDAYRGIAKEYNFTDYLLFVTWFPHLIAGPVLHHKQMMPQFASPATFRPQAESVAVGLTLFTIGLCKKVILADQFALYANPVFDGAAQGQSPRLFEAWIGTLAYALQLYFDFSGYSDMAIGLSRIFNIKLPLNFNSPYKAPSIIEFWRRWHITLSVFLRDYLYIPLGGNRNGPWRRQLNIMITMLLGGLWHGASWNFVLWGGLHGLYLVINHGWQSLAGGMAFATSNVFGCVSRVITFIAVVIAWVPFRAPNFESAWLMWKGMFGGNGVSLPLVLQNHTQRFLGRIVEYSSGMGSLLGNATGEILFCLAGGILIIWALPNSQEWLARYQPAWNPVQPAPGLAWRPTGRYAILVGALFGISLLLMNRVSPFLYYQF